MILAMLGGIAVFQYCLRSRDPLALRPSTEGFSGMKLF
ncbi:hypothetical protein ACUXPM_002914 [Ralstonia sp. 151470066-2]|jgi:hypothetical protein